MAPEYVGLEAALEAEASKLGGTAEGIKRHFSKRFDFGRAEELAKLAQGLHGPELEQRCTAAPQRLLLYLLAGVAPGWLSLKQCRAQNRLKVTWARR